MTRLLGMDTTGLIDTHSHGSGPSVFLRPGDWLVGSGTYRVNTLLGSCVSVVLWDAQWQVGAMCHCLLPQRPRHLAPGLQREAGHYVDEALAWMLDGLLRRGCSPLTLSVVVAGGAGAHEPSIGQANVEAALAGLAARGLAPRRRDTGGATVRKLMFNLANGELLIAAGGHGPHRRHAT